MDDLARAYLDRLWNVSAGVTVFAVVQILSFLYALQGTAGLVMHIRESWYAVLIATLSSGVAYSMIVVACSRAEAAILRGRQAAEDIVRVTTLGTIGQLMVIWLTTLAGVAVLAFDRAKGVAAAAAAPGL